ncbi:hypothetical protein GE107_08295 [Cohnella sp. CFH 77786]|uniref:hypothetical protein n=1 Tax=Cohnella sp. CFH 77786 TaxID=2662265 RepID=UPI001ED602BC|nr:hypothetical protein [Cohnella sp. CFH 77786]MBW5446060.1 hypothetical protein [Cohnella sp. CFH 77786]
MIGKTANTKNMSPDVILRMSAPNYAWEECYGLGEGQAARIDDTLKKQGVSCSVRLEHGTDIDAACGQLRSKQIQASS